MSAATSSGSTLIRAVTFTSWRIKSSETLYGASRSIELTSIRISATTGKSIKRGKFYQRKLWGFAEGVTPANGQNYRVTQLRFRSALPGKSRDRARLRLKNENDY